MKPLAFFMQLMFMAVLTWGTIPPFQAYSEKWHPLSNLREMKLAAPATHLFLGNSTMMGAIDTAEFAASHKGSKPLLMALGMSKTPEHYLFYKANPKHQQAELYYGFFDTQLTEDTHAEWSKLVDNRAVGYFCDQDEAIKLYTNGSALDELRFRVTAALPPIICRSSVWRYVESWRRDVGEIGMPKKRTNQFGRAEDFNQLLEDSTEFKRKCEQHVKDKVPLNDAVSGIFKIAREHGVQIYVIEMPMNSKHREVYNSSPEWLAYRAHIAELIREAGGTIVSAIDWVDDERFVDALHVDKLGARIFTKRLTEETSNQF